MFNVEYSMNISQLCKTFNIVYFLILMGDCLYIVDFNFEFTCYYIGTCKCSYMNPILYQASKQKIQPHFRNISLLEKTYPLP